MKVREQNRWYVILFLVTFLTGLVITPGASARPQHIYIFGDSLSDTGNSTILDDNNSDTQDDPSSPYYEGRSSNGPIWVDKLFAPETTDLSMAKPALQNNHL